MPHRTLLFTLILFGSIVCSCKTVSFQKYFPLEENTKYSYLCVVDSTHSEYTDTLICHAAITRRERVTLPNRLQLLDTAKFNSGTVMKSRLYLYYFEKLNLDSFARIYMNDRSFAELLYCFYKGRLYVSWPWEKSMQFWTDLDLLFPKRIRQGVDYKHRNGDYWKSFEYVGKENIKVDDRTYYNCLKMDIFETFGASKRIGTVWFARNVGLIKWEKKNEKVAFIKLLEPS